MVQDDQTRIEGVDFSALEPVLDELSYPVSSEEFVERHGDTELGRANADPITVEELFAYMGTDTFDSSDGVRQMILGQMPRNSEGRTNYSDRGGSLPVETEAAEEAAKQTAADLEEGKATDPDTTQQ